MAIGFNWKRATATAVNVSIASSLVINFSLLALQQRDVYLPYHISSGAVALLISLTIFIGVSFVTQPKKLDPDVEAVMEL